MCPFQISELLPKNQNYVNYNGSLTTPTCNEAVNWLLFLDPIAISSTQLNDFRKLKDGEGQDLVDNFRPVQPLNGRKVGWYNSV